LDGEGRIVVFNTTAEHILGHRARDVLGRPGGEVFDYLTDIVSGAGGGHPADEADEELKGNARHKDGRLVPLIVTAYPMPCGADRLEERAVGARDEESGPGNDDPATRDGTVLVFQDAQQLEKMENQLQHLDRLRSLDEFAAGIVHEIRNPLAGISINAQHLAEEIRKRCRRSCTRLGRPDRFGEEMQDILADVQSIESIVKKVLDFAHPNKPQVRACAVEDFVKETLRFSKMPLRRQGIRLVVDLSASARVRVDVSQMKQVLFNILRNARDAMPGGGELRVSTRNGTIRSKEPDLRATRLSGNGHVRVEVEDTGRGIAEEYLERIFDPFFSMHREGSGLGLAISRKIVENHGGRIEVRSRPGKGTRFAVVLPTV
jgi:signal transduction histidine kinase